MLGDDGIDNSERHIAVHSVIIITPTEVMTSVHTSILSIFPPNNDSIISCFPFNIAAMRMTFLYTIVNLKIVEYSVSI